MTPPLRAKITAFCSSFRPDLWSRIHPLASSGKVTWHFLLQRSNSSVAREIHTFRDSPSVAFRLKTWVSVSLISSLASFCGKRSSSKENSFCSPFSTWYSLGSRCSTHSKVFPESKVYTYAPRALADTLLSKVRSLFVTQTFHLLYSLPSSFSPENTRDAPSVEPMAPAIVLMWHTQASWPAEPPERLRYQY